MLDGWREVDGFKRYSRGKINDVCCLIQHRDASRRDTWRVTPPFLARMVVPFIEIRIVEEEGLPYIKIIISMHAWLIFRACGFRVEINVVFGYSATCFMMPAPGRDRITDCMVLTRLPMPTRHRIEVSHKGSEYIGWLVNFCGWSGSKKRATPIRFCFWRVLRKPLSTASH